MIRRAWVWAFGPGRFGGALLWTLSGLAVAVFVVALLVCTPVVCVAWGAALVGRWAEDRRS